MPFKILIADDEIKANQVVQKSYRQQIDNIVDFAGDGEEALRIIEANKSSPDLILVDLQMSPMGGIELINFLSAKYISIKIIAISAYISLDEIENNFQNNQNVLGFLEKPFDMNKLNEIIQQNFPLAISRNNFDYSKFDSETSVFVREQTEEIRGLMRRTAQGILDIGQKLLDIKGKLGHGNFSYWLKTEFNWSEPTAQRFMQVARKFKSINLMNLEIAPSALYILSAPSTSDVVRDEAIARAQAGESISYTTAKEIKQHYQSDSANKIKKDQKSEHVKNSSLNSSDIQQQSNDKTFSLDSSDTRELKASFKQEIIAVIPNQITKDGKALVRLDCWYQLGHNHLLYCGEPNSSRFKQRLPKEIALSIAFPNTPEWHLKSTVEATSELIFYSQYQDLDLITFKEMIQSAFELYTEDNEVVVFNYLPEADLLISADQLRCNCFIAEPNIEKCQSIIEIWNKQKII